MSLHSRLLLLVVGLLSLTIIAVSALLTFVANRETASQKEEDGLITAQLLARSAGVLDQVPEDVEKLIGDQMLIEARLIASLVALAEAPTQSTQAILQNLKMVTASTALKEITITDSQGVAYLQVPTPPYPFVFEKKSDLNRASSEFYPLLTGELKSLVQAAHMREMDNQVFKYAGVSGIDKPRIVQVGYDASFLDVWRQRLGFQRLVSGLLSSGSIEAIWIVDRNLLTLAFASQGQKHHAVPSEMELDSLEEVVKTGVTTSFFHKGALKIIAPIYGKNQEVSGATLMHLPTMGLKRILDQQLTLAGFVALSALILAAFATFLVGRWLTRPIEKMTVAAAHIENRTFKAELLEDLCDRDDELGRLARVFSNMGREVLTRAERLDALVSVRTKELQIKTKAVQEALDQLRLTQVQLVAKEKLASLGQLTAGISHELRNPLNFVVNFSELTLELMREVEELFEKKWKKSSGKEEELEELKKEGALQETPEEGYAMVRSLLSDVLQNTQKIYEHSKHAESIIATMIQHSRSGIGSAKAVKFNKFVANSLRLMRENSFTKDPLFLFNLEEALDENITEVEIIPEDFDRVLHYLFDNASYSLKEKKNALGEVYEPIMRLTTRLEGDTVTLIFYDNGVGIPENILNKIFNPFFTTKPTRRGSTGMGLSLCFDIVLQHRGEITVDSKEGEYAQFTIQFPRIQQKEE